MGKLEKFKKLGLSNNILQALMKKGFEEPTPIQEKIIPIALNKNKDLVGQAQTGTGKTAAFGIPIIENIEGHSKKVQVLIMTPTRELAIQVSEEINSIKGNKRLIVDPIYGGQSIELQLKRLKKGVDIVVGTPGRILDHINRRSLKLDEISYLVLDEADEMLNMGFIEDVEKIISVTNPDRMTFLFSATMPREIVDIARRHMKEYELIKIDTENITVELTDQIYFEVASKDKFEALCRIIDIENEFYGLVFCRTKVDVDNVATHLKDRGYDGEALHGDLSQHQREKISTKFRDKKINILVATDVAARGIDIENLTHVINYSIPQDPNSYVHRIGRTGRAGKEGTAITFITPEEYRKLMHIKRVVKTNIRREKLPQIEDILNVRKARVLMEIENIMKSGLSRDYLNIASDLLNGSNPVEVIAALLKQTYRNTLDTSMYNEIRDVYPHIEGKTRLFIAKGKKDDMNKRKLVGFIKDKAGIDSRKIQGVEVFDKYSFITVPFKQAEQILDCFKSESKLKKSIVEVANKKQKYIY